MKRYTSFDLRKLVFSEEMEKTKNVKFHLHKHSELMNLTSNLDIGIQSSQLSTENIHKFFTPEYRAPEVYTSIIDECLISPRCRGLTRYWGVFFNNYYAYNFINKAAKERYCNDDIFALDGDDILLKTENIKPIHIMRTAVWMYPFGNLDHFLRECLPLLLCIKEIGYEFDQLTFICPELKSDALDLLVALGIPKQNILTIGGNWFFCDRIILPCFSSFGHLHTPTSYYIDIANYINHTLMVNLNNKLDLPKRIYVSRRNAQMRRVVNEDILYSDLEQRGFSIIEPGEYSKIDQINLFQQAEIVIGPHGMGIANSVFSQKLKLLLEIMSTNYMRVSYFRTAQLRKAKYAVYCIDALPKDYSLLTDNYGDVLIDRRTFLAFLDKQIASI